MPHVQKRTACETRLNRWLEPFCKALNNKRRTRWPALYLTGLILSGERKSMERIAERVAPGEFAQLNHFISDSPWDTAPLEEVLCEKANDLLGGAGAHLIIDDTGIPKKGEHSVGVAHQYCGALGKKANSQCLVSVTLANGEIPVPVGLRLYLPKSWTDDRKRCDAVKVPDDVGYRKKWEIALEEIDRVIKCNVEFGDVLADAGYGMCAEFRRGLSDRKLIWTVGIPKTQNVYECDVEEHMPPEGGEGRPRKHPIPSKPPCSVKQYVEKNASFRVVTWRDGTKGKLKGKFCAFRIRPADGTQTSNGWHRPGDPVWLIAEKRETEIRYYLSNLPANTSLRNLARAVKARWACELAHQQMKEELGLDHFEGRSWVGLHHHTLLTMMAMAFLQTERIRENKSAALDQHASNDIARRTQGDHSATRSV